MSFLAIYRVTGKALNGTLVEVCIVDEMFETQKSYIEVLLEEKAYELLELHSTYLKSVVVKCILAVVVEKSRFLLESTELASQPVVEEDYPQISTQIH